MIFCQTGKSISEVLLSDDLIAMEQEKRIEMQKLYKLLQKGYNSSAESGGSRSVDVRQVRNALLRFRMSMKI